MIRFVLLLFLSFPAFSQTGAFGSFTNSDDIGAPPIKGKAVFDSGRGQYTITGSGADIWGKSDQFHLVWRSMSGNFAVQANAQFLSEGIAHRKAVIMLRKSLDADSPFVQLAIHGDGTPAVQLRDTAGGDVNTVDFPIEGPGSWQLKLERTGTTVTVWIGKDGGPLRELGHTLTQLGSPVLVGLGVSSHSVAATNTVQFTGVSVQELPTSSSAEVSAPLGIFSQSGDVGSPSRKGSSSFSNGEYSLTGSGANIWGKSDQFQYVWRSITGDFDVTTTLRFTSEGNEHRKGGIMVRQGLEANAPFAAVLVHGNGMPALQWRPLVGSDVDTFDLPFDGPGTFQIRLVRTGVKMFMYMGKNGAELKKVANTEVTFHGPVLVGLAVCAHQADSTANVVFSDVSVQEQAAMTASKTQ